MSELTRNIDTVTAEIVMIRENAKRVFFDAVIQIGTRLEEAKALVPPGEWLHYLEVTLGYKPSTAQNYMKIAREMGNGQIGWNGKEAGELFGRLGYAQLLPLMGVNAEERQELAEENDLAGMTSREVKRLVEDYKKAKAAAEHAEQRTLDAADALERAEKKRREAENAEADAREARKAAETRAAELQGRVDELLAAAKEAPVEASCTVLPDAEEMNALRAEVRAEFEVREQVLMDRLRRAKAGTAQKASIYFEQLLGVWENLLDALETLRAEDAEIGDKFRGAVAAAVVEFPEALDEMEETGGGAECVQA